MTAIRKSIAIILALALVMTFSLAGCGSKKKLIKEGTLIVGSDCDYPPFIWLDGDKLMGFEYELMQALAADMGLKLEYLPPQNFDTLIASVRGGSKMDIVVSSLTITDERAKRVDFCIPYFDSNQACVTKASADYKSVKDLEGKVVGAQAGTTGEAWANENIPGITMKPFNQTSEGLAALRAGQIEALFFDAPIAEYQIANDYKDLKIVEVIPTGEKYGFAVRQGNSELLNEVNASLQRLVNNGTYEKIFKKYFPNLESPMKKS